MNKINLYDKLFRFPAARHIIGEIKPYIKTGDKILDVGAGTGILAKQVADNFKVNVTLVDVADYRKVNLPIIIYNGKRLPFQNKSFDAALVVYVLHHTQDPDALLFEIKRVVKDKIVIYEDILTRNPFDKIDSFLHGAIFNKSWNLRNKSVFKSQKQWEQVFKTLNLKLIRAYPLPIRARLFYPVFRIQFVLQI